MDALTQLRRYVDEPTPDTYSDTELSQRITDAQGSLATVARDIWREKVAGAASLVNISEGGSTRGNSAIFDHYKDQLKYWQQAVDDEAAGGSVTVLRRLVR